LQDALIATPNLSYFVAENLLVSAMQLGARGCYSSLIATDPKYLLDMYEKSSNNQFKEAIEMQKNVASFFNEAEEFVEDLGGGTCDPVFDKGLSVAVGCLAGHQRCRPPYIGWSDETVKAVRRWVTENYPEFIFPES
jgi:dihydrodipicolinate synthase/N-acetylneuraminate lyase